MSHSGLRVRRRARLGHLMRRTLGSLSSRPPSFADHEWAAQYLSAGEADLWHRMSAADRRHSILVARRFAERVGEASRAEMAGALLHDVGKVVSDLGTLARVAATVIGPRTARFRQYHDHERLGAELLAAAGSDPVTVALVTGSGAAAPALRDADDI